MSDHDPTVQEHSLFETVKQWSKAALTARPSVSSAEAEEQVLSLVSELRLEHIDPQRLSEILDDPWLQEVLLCSPQTVPCVSLGAG